VAKAFSASLLIAAMTITVGVLTLSETAQAQAFRPFQESRISAVQWQEYFSLISVKFASSMRDLEKDHLQMYFDGATGVTYTFTKPSHPAHPAWVSRMIVMVDGHYAASQAGFYAGSQNEYHLLYASIAEMNERLRKGLSPVK
jgi:hypothetical protein